VLTGAKSVARAVQQGGGIVDRVEGDGGDEAWKRMRSLEAYAKLGELDFAILCACA
jgi:hypothetical protein